MTSKEAKYDEWKRYFFEVDKEMYEYFIQDLERLEVLDKLVTDDCIAGNEVGLQIVNNLIERSNKYRDENKQLKERLEALEKENKKWREIVGCDLCEALDREILLEENEKLKKAIEILKGKLELCESMYSQIFNSNEYYILCNKTLTQQEYELLKEVLCND